MCIRDRCLAKAKKKKALTRSLGIELSPQQMEKLEQEIKDFEK